MKTHSLLGQFRPANVADLPAHPSKSACANQFAMQLQSVEGLNSSSHGSQPFVADDERFCVSPRNFFNTLGPIELQLGTRIDFRPHLPDDSLKAHVGIFLESCLGNRTYFFLDRRGRFRA